VKVHLTPRKFAEAMRQGQLAVHLVKQVTERLMPHVAHVAMYLMSSWDGDMIQNYELLMSYLNRVGWSFDRVDEAALNGWIRGAGKQVKGSPDALAAVRSFLGLTMVDIPYCGGEFKCSNISFSVSLLNSEAVEVLAAAPEEFRQKFAAFGFLRDGAVLCVDANGWVTCFHSGSARNLGPGLDAVINYISGFSFGGKL
jgi:hypothetical protein